MVSSRGVTPKLDKFVNAHTLVHLLSDLAATTRGAQSPPGPRLIWQRRTRPRQG